MAPVSCFRTQLDLGKRLISLGAHGGCIYAVSALIAPNGISALLIIYSKFHDPFPLQETGFWLGLK